jgi:hypothetical protein
MPSHHSFDQGHSSNPSKDPSFHHTTFQSVRQQGEGTCPSSFISAAGVGNIADSLHRHITDTHPPANQDQLSLYGTNALRHERRRRVQSQLTSCRRREQQDIMSTAASSVVATPCSNTTMNSNRTTRYTRPRASPALRFPGDSNSLSKTEQVTRQRDGHSPPHKEQVYRARG